MSYSRPRVPPPQPPVLSVSTTGTPNLEIEELEDQTYDDPPPPYTEMDADSGLIPPALPPRSPRGSITNSGPPIPPREYRRSASPAVPPRPPPRSASSLSVSARVSRNNTGGTDPAAPILPPRSPLSTANSIVSNATGTPRDTRDYAVRSEPQVSQMTTSFEAMSLGTNGSRREIDFNKPLSVDPPPRDLFQYVSHDVPLPSAFAKLSDSYATETNKFHGNLLLGNQTNPVWTHPYSLWINKEPDGFKGLAVSYTEARQRVFDTTKSPPQYFFSPTNIKSFVFNAMEFGNNDAELALSEFKHMSAYIYLKLNDMQFMWTPIVQGMGFISTVYNNLTPRVQSAVGFRKVEAKGVTGNNTMARFRITLENDVVWSLYVSDPSLGFYIADSNHSLVADKVVKDCLLQLVADDKRSIDAAAGCYPVGVELSASIGGSDGGRTATYTFTYAVRGQSPSGRTLLYAAPHHVAYLTDEIQRSRVDSTLDATVLGQMSGYNTNTLSMNIEVPGDRLGFAPFTTIPGKSLNYSPEVLDAIRMAAISEIQGGDVVEESNMDSMYFSGKVLAKYAWILYCCHYILHDTSLTTQLLPKLKLAIDRFATNKQKLPLRYDTTWGGMVSSGNASQDFGNSYYNDHHFHYGYHIIAAAIVASIDSQMSGGTSSWLAERKEFVELLVRDYANPSVNDRYFPVFRSFDWFNGHSWAKGLFPSGDGKDEESSSEDVNASYALKLWGLATGNQNLIDIGDLQLGILKTSTNRYMLYEDSNTVQPANFIPNKVSGILFENKIDHTTYFGNKIEYIQMIHAIPIIPPSSFIRTPTFVREEWEQILEPIVGQVNDGWRGIIMLNVALFDPKLSYSFFSQPNFNRRYLDGGQSLTWSLASSGAFI